MSLCCWTQCERLRCRCHKMSFLTIRSLSARPRRRLALGRDGELGPISPKEIDDLLDQVTTRPLGVANGRIHSGPSSLPAYNKRAQVQQIIRPWNAVDRWRVIILKVYGVQEGDQIVSGRHFRLGRASCASLRSSTIVAGGGCTGPDCCLVQFG